MQLIKIKSSLPYVHYLHYLHICMIVNDLKERKRNRLMSQYLEEGILRIQMSSKIRWLSYSTAHSRAIMAETHTKQPADVSTIINIVRGIKKAIWREKIQVLIGAQFPSFFSPFQANLSTCVQLCATFSITYFQSHLVTSRTAINTGKQVTGNHLLTEFRNKKWATSTVNRFRTKRYMEHTL